jgi:formate dehydrogenase major subunit
MDLVKLEIDGQKVIADGRRTILEVARERGIGTIPTLCHDGQLEPFSSCFLCVVKVKGARTLLPACSTRIAAGMVVETNVPEVRQARRASLELMLSNHYADCIGPCQLECPAGIDIQGYIALAALGKYTDAVRLIKERNPLPAVCGRVCTRPCEVRGCRRNLVDEAVGIDYIKRYLADLELGRREPFRPPTAPPSGRRVAIIGGGPAGLSCAYYLALRGYACEIFEAMPEAGGMLRYGIPEYRLPKEVLDLEISQILDLGVKLRTNVALGEDVTILGLRESGFDAVFLAIGAWDSAKLRVPDEETPGVLAGIDFLRDYGLQRAARLDGRVVVVGGGNTAIDCARTALRLGASDVRLLYRRTRDEMPANAPEIVEAEEEGVRMEFLVAPVRVLRRDGRLAGLECIRMELGEPDASGRRSPRPIRGSELTVDCEVVIAAIGQGTTAPELVSGRIPAFLPPGEDLGLTRWQTIQAAPGTFETSVDGVFAGGDVVSGAATAIEAIAAGRKAAHAIDAYVRTGAAEAEPAAFTSRRDAFRTVTADDLRDGVRTPRRPMPVLPPAERVRSFAEVEQGYGLADLRQETARCLECGCQALFECDLRRYATEYGADITPFLGEVTHHRVDRRHPLIELDPNKCILCGACVRICSELVGAAAYGFVNRGFSTVVRPALGGSLLETGCVSCGLCISVCPTGAIVERIPLVKPGPWPTTSTPTICDYCGVGCRLGVDTYGDTLVKMSRREDGHVAAGLHCRRGRFGHAYVQDRERLVDGRIRAGRELQPASPEEAIAFAALRLKELLRSCRGDEIAVFVSPRLTNEELYLAQKLARVVLKTHQVTTFARLVNGEWDCPEVVSTATYADVVDAQGLLVVNADLAADHFVVDLLVKKAIRGGARLIHVGPKADRTSEFAEVVLRCAAGAEPLVLLALWAEWARLAAVPLGEQPDLEHARGGRTAAELAAAAGVAPEDVAAAAEILAASLVKTVIFSKDHRGPRAPGDERLFARIADAFAAPILALREKSNMQGLLDLGASPGWLPGYAPLADAAAVDACEKEWCTSLADVAGGGADVAERLRRREIKVALVLGEDPLGDPDLPGDLVEGLLAAELLVVGDLFLTATARAAHVVLPLSAAVETSGTLTNQERRVQRLERAVPPPSGLETWQVICELAARMGYRFKMRYASAAEVTDEIRRVVPAYRGVEIDSPDGAGVWALDGRRPPGGSFDPASLATPARPVATLALDHLEARFAARFDEAIETARAALVAVEAAGAARAAGEPAPA